MNGVRTRPNGPLLLPPVHKQPQGGTVDQVEDKCCYGDQGRNLHPEDSPAEEREDHDLHQQPQEDTQPQPFSDRHRPRQGRKDGTPDAAVG